MAKSYVLPALCAVSAVLTSAQFLEAPKGIATKLKALHLGEHAPSEEHVTRLEKELTPIFTALPKKPRGALRPPTARYALHRLFTELHGWHFNGLAPSGDTWDSSSPTSALGDRVPQDVSRALHERLTEHGLSLRELAQFAALLEQMVHAEADVRLAAAFDALKLPWDANLDENQSSLVLETYMASFVLGSKAHELEPSAMLQKLQEVHEQYPTWPATQRFLHEIRAEVAPSTNSTFAVLSEVAAAVGERYGRWQSHECSDLRTKLLLKEEQPNTGRVRLSDFYGLALHGGQWQFSESTSYLRQLGALDESDPEVLRLIVTNYLLGPSNCIASSGYFAVCCLDPCEARWRHLESEVQNHEAPPQRLLSALNHSVSLGLQQKLHDLAEHHGGQVPLHSRLFAQWMHHLYPQECSYPHMSGTIKPLQPELVEMGEPVSASEEEMMQHVEAAGWKKSRDLDDGLCSNMWTMEEELVDPAQRAPAAGTGARRGLVLALAVASLATTIGKMAMAMWPSNPKSKVYSV